MMFNCYVTDCKWNKNGEDCTCPYGPNISDKMLTAAGFMPMCEDYEERKGGKNDGNH